MNTKRYLFVLIFGLFMLNPVYAIEFAGCCYDGNELAPVLSSQDCSFEHEKFIELDQSAIDSYSGGNQNICEQTIPITYCSPSCDGRTDNGLVIYDHEDIKSIPEIDSYCNGGFYDTISDCEIYGSTSQNSNSGAVTGSGNSDSTISNGDSIYDNLDGGVSDSEGYLDEQFQDQIESCRDAGGLLGLFMNKNGCESVEGCIFNSYLGGILGNDFDDTHYSYSYYEKNSCIPKEFITVCSDYKSQFNCEGNRAKVGDALTDVHSELEYGCRWINSSQYTTSGFDDVRGICVSNYSLSNYYKISEINDDRFNVISNSGFENSGVWSVDQDDFVRDFGSSIMGEYYYELTRDNNLYQRIDSIYGVYKFHIYVYNNGTFNSNDRIFVEILEYDSENNFLGTNKGEIQLSNLNLVGAASRLQAQVPFSIDSTDVSYVNLSISTNVDSVLIDSLSLFSSRSKFDNPSYAPIEIISKDASYCELCFDSVNFNYCTQEKSDLLGDCSYMVSGPNQSYGSDLEDEYSGRFDNSYKEGFNGWKSQSLANSLLFCEMYVREDQCEDVDNYVNGFSHLHPNVNGTLCKWDENIGCFKDSNGDNFPDVFRAIPTVSRQTSDENSDLEIDTYIRKTDRDSAEVNYSDFAYGCDVIPPVAQVYFEGVSAGGDVFRFTKDNVPEDVLGKVKLFVDINDIGSSDLESCKNLNFDLGGDLGVDYSVNGSSFKTKSLSSPYRSLVEIKDFFTDDESYLGLFSDGNNEIDFSIMDRSGNVGLDYSISNLVLDVGPPQIDMLSSFDGTYGRGASIEIEVSDYSVVDSCSYYLYYEGLQEAEYSGELNLTEISNPDSLNGYKTEVILPYDERLGTNAANAYLYVSCEDVFGQAESTTKVFLVDFDTGLTPFEPEQYYNYTQNSGYFNGGLNITLLSTDNDIVSDMCSYTIDGNSGSSDIVVNEIVEGYVDNNMPEENFTRKVSLDIDENELGRGGLKNINVTCYDIIGNSHSEILRYFYDPQNPIFFDNDFSLTNMVDNDRNTTYFDGTDYYYSGDLDDLKVDFIVDGTLSSIFEVYNLSVEKGGTVTSNLRFKVVSTNDFHRLSTESDFGSEHSFNEDDISVIYNTTTGKTSFSLSSFHDPVLYGGEEVENDSGLKYMEYDLAVADMAGNEREVSFGFNYDGANPAFNFGGEVNEYSGKLYSRVSSPDIEIDFGTPSYRDYSCDAALFGSDGSMMYTQVNPESFNLADINERVNVSKYEYELKLSCVDNYGPLRTISREIIYDNTVPVLEGISFTNNPRYVNSNFQRSVTSDLVFEFSGNEKFYNCSYVFESFSDEYSCSTQSQNLMIDPGTNMHILEGEVLIGSYGTGGGHCSRENVFSQTDETKIRVHAQCSDVVGLETELISEDFELNYVSGSLFGFGVEYSEGNAVFEVSSLMPSQSIIISSDPMGDSELAVLISSGTENGIYRYSAQVSLSNRDIAALSAGQQIYAVGTDGDYKSLSWVEDRYVPNSVLDIPVMIENTVVAETFVVNIDISDISANPGENSANSLEEIVLELDGEEIFSLDKNGFNSVDSVILESGLFTSDYVLSGSKFDSGSGIVINGSGILDDSNILTLTVRDAFGNVGTDELTFRYIEGFGIIAVDTLGSVNADGRTWYTAQDNPTFKFVTSQDSSHCVVTQSIGDLTPVDLRNYSFTLKKSLSEYEDKETRVHVKCFKDASPTEYSTDEFAISYIQGIADYVLESSEGFNLNEEPFVSDLKITNVGPFDEIFCSYMLNGNTYELGSVEDIKTLSVGFQRGRNDFTLICTDMFGRVGPEKLFVFNADSGGSLIMDNLYAQSSGDAYVDLQGDAIYINDRRSFGIGFSLNKKDGVSCTYSFEGEDSFLVELGEMFIGLFSDNSQKLYPQTPYEYFIDVGDLAENYDTYLLDISCSYPMGSSVSKEFDIYYQTGEEPVSFDIE